MFYTPHPTGGGYGPEGPYRSRRARVPPLDLGLGRPEGVEDVLVGPRARRDLACDDASVRVALAKEGVSGGVGEVHHVMSLMAGLQEVNPQISLYEIPPTLRV